MSAFPLRRAQPPIVVRFDCECEVDPLKLFEIDFHELLPQLEGFDE
jgi:hypothetical protein